MKDINNTINDVGLAIKDALRTGDEALLARLGINREQIGYMVALAREINPHVLKDTAVSMDKNPLSTEQQKERASEIVARQLVGAGLRVLYKSGDPEDRKKANVIYTILEKAHLHADPDGIIREDLDGPNNQRIMQVLKKAGIEDGSFLPASVIKANAALQTPNRIAPGEPISKTP